MPNREHVTLVREGGDAVAMWSIQNPGQKLELDHADLRSAKLANLMLLNVDLQAAELSDADLSGASLMAADLTGAELFRAKLRGAELNGVCLRDADLRYADLAEADLKGADLTGADLTNARLEGANLKGANLTGANLEHADLSGCKMRGAILRGARLVATNFSQAFVAEVIYDRHDWVCAGINVTTCYGNPFFKRDAEDQDLLDHYQQRHPRMFRLWSVTSDCGRSIGRVFAISTILVFGFGVVYALPWFDLITVGATKDTWFAPFYYSIVTFTTLGFGDITPSSLAGQFLVVGEVLFGYLALGMLVSILANKVARRA